MQLYTKNEKKNYSFIINFWRYNIARNNIALYKSCVCCKHKTSLVRYNDYFRSQYAFRN